MAKNRTRKLRNHRIRRDRLAAEKRAAQERKTGDLPSEPVLVTSPAAKFFYASDDHRVARIAEKNRVQGTRDELVEKFGDREIAA